MSKKYIMCKQCVMDTTDPEIFFDDEGICNHCRRYELLKNSYPHNLNEKEKKRELQKIIEELKIILPINYLDMLILEKNAKKI